jgi:hypothetical protein
LEAKLSQHPEWLKYDQEAEQAAVVELVWPHAAMLVRKGLSYRKRLPSVECECGGGPETSEHLLRACVRVQHCREVLEETYTKAAQDAATIDTRDDLLLLQSFLASVFISMIVFRILVARVVLCQWHYISWCRHWQIVRYLGWRDFGSDIFCPSCFQSFRCVDAFVVLSASLRTLCGLSIGVEFMCFPPAVVELCQFLCVSVN